MDARTSGL